MASHWSEFLQRLLLGASLAAPALPPAAAQPPPAAPAPPPGPPEQDG